MLDLCLSGQGQNPIFQLRPSFAKNASKTGAKELIMQAKFSQD